MTLPAIFRCPPLTEDEIDAFSRLAERAARELVLYSTLEGGPIKWRLHTTETNLQVFEGFDARGPTNERVWCAWSEVQATIEEVHMMTYAETSQDYKDFTQKFHPDILDAARLYNIVEPTEERPLQFVGVNWALQKSPGKGLIKNRDWCFVEGHFEMEVQGQRAWVRAMKSVNIACCPDLQADCGYIRAMHTRAGYIFMETDRPGYLRCIQYNQGFVKGEVKNKMTDWLYASSIVGRYRKIAELEVVIRKYRLSKATFLPKSSLKPVDKVNQCHVCNKPFSKSKKLNCRKCGEVICRHCSKLYEVKVHGKWGEVRVCEPCVFGKVETSGSSSNKPAYLRNSSSKSSSEEWISKLNHSASELSLEDSDDSGLFNSHRDTLVEGTIDIRSKYKPVYKPAMAEKFHVDGFFTPRGESESATTVSSTAPQIYLLDEAEFGSLYRHTPVPEDILSNDRPSYDESAFFVLNHDSDAFDDHEYLRKYLCSAAK